MMGQSLNTLAVSGGNMKSYSLSDEALAALKSGDVSALLASHKARFGGYSMKLEDDTQDDTDDDDTSGDGDDDESDDDESDDDNDDDDDKPKGKSSSRIKELSDENARHRMRNKQLKKDMDELRAELKELKDKDKPDDEKVSEELSTLKQENEALSTKVEDLAIRNAFLSSNEFKWKNPKAALRLADLSEVEIDEDGEVSGLKEALKKLAKSDPYLLDEGKDEDDDDEPEDRNRQTGQPTSRRKKGNPNRDKLLEKYPALRR